MSKTTTEEMPSLYEGLLTTRTIRRYKNEAISTGDLSRILFAATRAPSGHNTQPYRFIVLRKDAAAERARALLAEGFQAAWSEHRTEPAPEATDRKSRMARTMNEFVDGIAGAPVVIVACYERGRVADGLVGGASIFPACHNLLLAARSLGYGGVISQWHRPVEAELSEVLGLPNNFVIAATIPLGRPAGSHGPVRRRPIWDLVFETEFGQRAEWLTEPDGTRYSGG